MAYECGDRLSLCSESGTYPLVLYSNRRPEAELSVLPVNAPMGLVDTAAFAGAPGIERCPVDERSRVYLSTLAEVTALQIWRPGAGQDGPQVGPNCVSCRR
jgi:hypothetical protein